ncbi:MAG TPA: EscU/YscU/HrcU family type III secretion system export apparatus switch protein [Kofleriaceae bacterium]|nr:EscU/YscU/HrcU family type III secretion system export apparatus switch protein [Kofleriaceae bacterium]
MAEHRPFPATARRRALARQAGLHPGSPLLVGALAAAALLAALTRAGAAALDRLGAAVAAACTGRAALAPDALPRTVLALALPLVGAAALAAAIAQLAQARAAWLPRRRIPGAPVPEAGPLPRTRRAAGELAAAAGIGAIAFGALWWAAPHLAALLQLELPALVAGAAGLLASLAAAIAVAWCVAGVLDALARHAAFTRSLAMTAAEKREDDRLAGADPRWRARRAAIQRGQHASSARDAIAGAALLVLGDDAAVAIAWDPVRRPIPVRTATGRGPRATQLLGLARRYQLPVHRDPALAAALVDHDGPVPEPEWPRLAAILAAAAARRA